MKQGLEILDALAGKINGLGPVLWSDLAQLNRANYSWRQEGAVLRLRPYSRKLKVSLPAGATELVVDRSLALEREVWTVAGHDSGLRPGEPLPLGRSEEACLALELKCPAPSIETNGCPVPAWALARRLLAEARDRAVGSWH